MDKKIIKEIIISSALYSLGSIFGPLVVIGGLGLILDKVFKTYPWFLFISIFLAFVVTNVLLFKKIKKINRLMDNYSQKAKTENTIKNNESSVDQQSDSIF